MLLDWFTIFAQILNFFVLLILLKMFLYSPIVDAMRERRNKVADELAETRKAREKAEFLTLRLQAERDALNNRAAEVMAEIHAESEKWRQQAMDNARAEIDSMRVEWLAALSREKDSVALNLRKRLTRELAATASRMVHDLADSELEELVLSGFMRRIADEARNVDCGSSEILIRTGFEQSDEQRHNFDTLLAPLFPKQNERIYLHVPELGLGVELIAGDRKWEWNLASYVDELERKILEDIRD